MRGKRSLRLRCWWSCLGLKHLVIVGLAVCFFKTDTAAAQTGDRTDGPVILDISMPSASVVQIRYHGQAGETSLELPVELFTQLVEQFSRQSPGSNASVDSVSEADSPPSGNMPGRVFKGSIKSEQAGMYYIAEHHPDGSVRLTPEAGDVITIPSDVVRLVAGQVEYLAGGRDRVWELGVNMRDGSLFLNFESAFNYRILIVLVGILLGIIVYGAVKISTRRIKKERDELARSRKRMVKIREAERSHLASELHDGPMQDLLRVISSYVAPLSKMVLDGGQEYLYGMETGLRDVAGGLRNICSDLKPPVLAHFGLEKAMAAYVREFELRNPGIRVDLNMKLGSRRLPMEIRLPLYRIFQEALTNVERHSSARQVDVSLRRRSDRIELSVVDDGIGFNQPTRLFLLEEEGHFGISGMAQRAQSVGGTLRVESSPGNGTRIGVLVPLPEAELIEI